MNLKKEILLLENQKKVFEENLKSLPDISNFEIIFNDLESRYNNYLSFIKEIREIKKYKY